MTVGAGREVFLGVDVGTQGARVVALDADGRLHAERHQAFDAGGAAVREQSASVWWATVLALLGGVASDLAAHPGLRPVALGVTSTSGTVVPLDDRHEPVHPALMYGDDRSGEEAALCRRVAAAAGTEAAFGTSFGLPKILWFRRHRPTASERTASWCHASDFLVGRLSGVWGVTDPTNALKSGYDPAAGRWPGYLFDELAVPRHWLPRVAPSGTPLGPISPEVARDTGLPPTVLVTNGMTDGCASQIAAGAIEPGQWSTTLGTTMVVKGVTRGRLVDGGGRLYSHLHPDGWWMPGGASNTGAGWIARDYAGEDPARLDAAARPLSPTPWAAYPLATEGERFPFVCAAARGFEPAGLNPVERYAARLEGVAYLERLAYELVERLAGEPVRAVFTTGGGSKSDLWLGIRAAVLGRPVVRPRHPEGAVGAAILAASGTCFGSLAEAGRRMTHREAVVEPPGVVAGYEEGYARFVEALVARGYVAAGEVA